MSKTKRTGRANGTGTRSLTALKSAGPKDSLHKPRGGSGRVQSRNRVSEPLYLYLKDEVTHVLLPIDEYEQLVMGEMAQAAIAQIESGDDDFIDADQFALEMAGEKIAKARKAAGLTQKQLGAKLRIPQSQISRIERHPDHTTVKTLKRIAKALKVDVRALL